jgi:predicted DNA binding protein
MWVMKLRMDAKTLFLGSLAIKHKVAIFGSPLSFSYKNKELYLQVCGVLVGSNKDAFLKDFEKDKRVVAVEVNKDLVVASYKTKGFVKWLDNDHFIHSAHLSIDFDGLETLTLESFQKSSLMLLFSILKKKYSAELICIEQKDSSVIPVLRSAVSLTSKQRLALELALSHGYYKFPRLISVLELSKIAGVSFSTFQQHLRKAESKVLPAI